MPSVRILSAAVPADVAGYVKATNDSLPTIRLRWNQPSLADETDESATELLANPENRVYAYDNSDVANGMSVAAVLAVRSFTEWQLPHPGSEYVDVNVLMLAVARRTAGEGIATTRTRLIAAFKALAAACANDLAAVGHPVVLTFFHPNIVATDISGTAKKRIDLMVKATGIVPVLTGTLLCYRMTPAQLLAGSAAV